MQIVCTPHLSFNTGAIHNFISRTFAEKYGLNVRPATASVHCTGSTEVKTVSHIVTARLHMQSLKCDESFLVMDLPPGLDACLGDSWLAKHHALWSYEHKCLRLKKEKEWCMIKFDMNDDDVNEMDEDLPPPPKQGVPLLSAVQVKSMMKEPGSRYSLLNVTVLSDNDETGERKVLIDEVLAGYESVFDEMKTCPPHRSVSHVIDTGDHGPVSLPMHRLSPKEKVEVERQVQELLVKGLIQPSNSPYGAPVLFVQKKDGSLRMCIDYRALNNLTRKDKYPLPRIDDLIDRLQGARVFSSLDLQSGYHQIRITDDDVPKTAFRTHLELYEFNVLSFGLTNAPAAFQRQMNDLFRGLPFVVVYLDDILVFSKNNQDHKKHLRQVLKILKNNQFYAKRSKCSFFERSVKFLGHVISDGTLTVDPAKVDSILKWPDPKNAHDVRSFLGLGNHFKKFIQGYSKLTAPLVELTKPSVNFDFDVNVAAQEAFMSLKDSLTHAPVLAIPDVNKPFEVVCDASGFGCGAVLN